MLKYLVLIFVPAVIIAMLFLRAYAKGPSAKKFLKAVEEGNTQAVGSFIKKGIDANVRDAKFDEEQNTALIIASIYGHKDIVEMLLKAKADPNARYDDGGNTALKLANQKGYTEIADILKNAGAKE